jgi:hypothetical protein
MYLNIGRVQLDNGDKITGCATLLKAMRLSEEIGAQDCLDVSSQLLEAYGCERS